MNIQTSTARLSLVPTRLQHNTMLRSTISYAQPSRYSSLSALVPIKRNHTTSTQVGQKSSWTHPVYVQLRCLIGGNLCFIASLQQKDMYLTYITFLLDTQKNRSSLSEPPTARHTPGKIEQLSEPCAYYAGVWILSPDTTVDQRT